ncbi:unnamed protein product [Tilletia controversa]|uniref:Uncharacterized protein n=3 Tax=Tilletia TaxID=13289 RepID=A0A8X7MN22_9BASI|nr:hypothetical protein CF336_g6423 [Tilletia laevis]KAE8190324.1 hypothetical protein CF328_g6008 [Tilletia controversa]KAE8253912.1 hypothetical protein A4X03_0g5790 [Tilletia caries]KAE8192673.1 hypothetical protein CF335_g5781 [Tilletia laevis]KAE8242371.1 hypothetical protein A4X06_0g6962 [Tilletia controversa]
MPAISHLVHDLPTFTSTPHIPLVLDTRHLVDLTTVDKADARTIHPKSISDLVFIPYHARSNGAYPAPLTKMSRIQTSRSLSRESGGDDTPFAKRFDSLHGADGSHGSQSFDDSYPRIVSWSRNDPKAAHSVQESHPGLITVKTADLRTVAMKKTFPNFILAERIGTPSTRSIDDSESTHTLEESHPALILLNRPEARQLRPLPDEHPVLIVLSLKDFSALRQVHVREISSRPEYQQLAQRGFLGFWKDFAKGCKELVPDFKNMPHLLTKVAPLVMDYAPLFLR